MTPLNYKIYLTAELTLVLQAAKLNTGEHRLWFFDQDILNSYFKGRFLLLDGRWNTRDAARSPEGLIQHFAGKPKPWQMAPHEMELIGLTAWARARADTGFEPAPPSIGSAVSRRLGNGVSWVQRQVRKRLGGRSSSSAK